MKQTWWLHLVHVCVATLVVMLCALSVRPAWSQNAVRTIASAEIADPLELMGAALELERAGNKDEAVFWFYAGQLRARYASSLTNERGSLFAVFLMAGEPVNAHAQRDIRRMGHTIRSVLSWDENTLAAWAKKHDVDVASPKLRSDRRAARDGLLAMMEEFSAKRDHYEALARAYKDPDMVALEQEQAYARQIRENFSTKVVERVIADQRLRLPVNYISPTGKKEPERAEVSDLTLAIFFPRYEGYAVDSPLRLLGVRNLMWLRINDRNVSAALAERFEAFISTQPKMTRAFGSDAFVFDESSQRLGHRLPLHGYSTEHIFVLDRPDRGRTYMSCSVDLHATNPDPRCLMFITHRSGLRLSAMFSQDHGNDWRAIAGRIDLMVDAWLVR